MIFVTVGTHEQPFDRLIVAIDRWRADGILREEVVIQTGSSTYEPRCCRWEHFFSPSEMEGYIKRAKIVITHGGPSSFIASLRIGKIPVVVPRQKRFGEHINDHQMDFCRAVAERQGNIILVEDIGKLRDIIQDYDGIISHMPAGIESNNERFLERFERIVDRLMEGDRGKDK